MITPSFNFEKTINGVLYVVSKVKHKDFHKIFKILYFADREHFAKYGRPITGDVYIKMPAGPVPSKLYDLVKVIKGDSFFSSVPSVSAQYSAYFSVIGEYFIEPKIAADLSYLSESDIEELDLSIKTYGEVPFKELANISHNMAWSSVEDAQKLKFEDILREANAKDDFIEYIDDFMSAQKCAQDGFSGNII
jgi:uncharacterized phage-associated protein